jgi:hypothetical protein
MLSHENKDTAPIIESILPQQQWSSLMFVIICLAWVLYMILVSEVAIVSTYVQLCHEDYHWWWRSYFVGTSPAFYLFNLGLFVRITYPFLYKN